METNSMLLKNQCINEEIKKEIKRYLKTNDNKDTTTGNLWDATKAVFRGDTGPPQKRRKISHGQLNPPPK